MDYYFSPKNAVVYVCVCDYEKEEEDKEEEEEEEVLVFNKVRSSLGSLVIHEALWWLVAHL